MDLRLFCQVVAEGSITAGAVRMHLSLPSASARIRALERDAGLPLLVRGRRGVRPTPAGTALARHAREILAGAARLDGAIATYGRTPVTSLTLLAGSSAMHRLVPQALAAFLGEHSDVDVTVTGSPSVRSVALLAEGAADLGVLLEAEALGSGLDTEPLGDDALVVIGPAGGVLAGAASMTVAEVAEHPMVGLDAGSPLQISIDRHAGATAPAARYRTRVAGLGTVVALAEAGIGVAIVPRRVLDPAARLDVCELRETWARRRLVLGWGAAAGRSSPAVAAFAAHLAEVASGRP